MGRTRIIYKKKLRSFINFMANETFLSATKNYKNKSLIFDFNFKNELIRLNVSIQHDLSVGGLSGNGFDISGSSSDEDIYMHILIYDRSFQKTSYNEFNAEVREFLRHEMEHIAQYHNCPGKAEIYGCPPSNNELEYFTQPSEIDAFLYGLNYKRKYLKTNIIHEINHLLHNYYRIRDLDMMIPIQNAWITRLKEILPHTL
jgi:hypothetical protein